MRKLSDKTLQEMALGWEKVHGTKLTPAGLKLIEWWGMKRIRIERLFNGVDIKEMRVFVGPLTFTDTGPTFPSDLLFANVSVALSANVDTQDGDGSGDPR